MIAYGMLYATAVGLPILLLAMLGSSVLRREGRAERWVWLVALGLALTLPALGLARSDDALPTTPGPVQNPGSVPVSLVETGLIGLPTVVAVPTAPTVTLPVARSTLGLDEILVGLWMLASLTLTVRWVVAARRLARLIGSCRRASVDGVHVSLTTDLGPAVSGVVEPHILVPSWLMSMPSEQRSLVLAHEEEHVRGRDPLLFAVSRIARILTPWNPVVWLLSSRLHHAIELDCDRRVLRRHPDVEAYGTTLLTVSSRDPGGLLGVAAFAESEAPLRRRILAMTTPPRTVSLLGLLTALVLGVVLIIGAFQVPTPSFRMEVGMEPPGIGAVAEERAEAEEAARRHREVSLDADMGDRDRLSEEILAEWVALLAEQEAAERRVLSLEERLSLLEESQIETTRRAEVAESLVRALSERVQRAESERRAAGALGPWDPASTGTVTGVVRREATGQPVANVQVSVTGTGLGGLSNDQGRILLLDVPAGRHRVVVQRIGYGEVTRTITVVEGEVTELDVRLSQVAVPLQGVLVTGTGVEGRRGGRVEPSASDPGGPLIYVDGVRVRSTAGPLGRYLDGLREASAIERVEVIKGPAAVAEYGEHASGGVVLITLKHGSEDTARPIRPGVPGRPVFTPYSVPPRVLNVEEVQRAMLEAYPPELRAEGIGGTVEVYFFIEEDGHVRDTRIASTSGYLALDDAALAVADVYRFSPALNRDEPVAVWVAFPITFVQEE